MCFCHAVKSRLDESGWLINCGGNSKALVIYKSSPKCQEDFCEYEKKAVFSLNMLNFHIRRKCGTK